jgi:hypothetical protein
MRQGRRYPLATLIERHGQTLLRTLSDDRPKRVLTPQKRLVECDRQARTGQATDRSTYIGCELNGRTVAVLGTGNVGGRLATMCRTASTCACWPMIPSYRPTR